MRVPSNNLKIFNWYNSCMLEAATLTLLFKHQGATLRGFCITRYSEPQNVSDLLINGLQNLSIRDLNIEQKCEWPSRLIIQNRETLRYLHLGVLSTVAQEYAMNPRPSQHTLPSSFAEVAKKALPASEREAMPKMFLNTLGLYGLNLENIVGGATGLEVDFNSMTSLRLESCSGLIVAFDLLLQNDGSQTATLSALKLTSFFVRHENGGQKFAQQLTAFLTSFTGLKHLGLLLQGQCQAMSKAPILEMHGKTLQTLVWDERKGSRHDTTGDPSLFGKDNNLKLISLKCPNLTALGLPVGWYPSRSTAKLPNLSLMTPKLRTLHLRNLPKTDLTSSFLPTDDIVKSLAFAIQDMYSRGKPPNRQMALTTIALGAPLYRDIHIGSNHFPSEPVRDYLQLRVYHVDYKCQSVLGPSPTVTQVAKGTADDATTCFDKDVLHEYWLS